MKAFGAWIVWFWNNHVQKTLGALLLGSALFDLMSALDLYQATLTQILGLHWYSVIRGTCAVGIVLRAVIKPKT
jgi:hypothetical protein